MFLGQPVEWDVIVPKPTSIPGAATVWAGVKDAQMRVCGMTYGEVVNGKGCYDLVMDCFIAWVSAQSCADPDFRAKFDAEWQTLRRITKQAFWERDHFDVLEGSIDMFILDGEAAYYNTMALIYSHIEKQAASHPQSQQS